MIFAISLSVLQLVCVSATLGDGLWRTFAHQTALPISASDAEDQGWVAQSTSCDTNLGILFAQSANGVSEDHPLGLYFTLTGQIAGVQATVYGSDKVGNAAPDHLVDLGYWKKDDGEKWHMDVSFRAPSEICATTNSTDLVGDRVVINQDTIAQSIPLKAGEARAAMWTQGSCMSSMGQHHFYDLSAAPKQSYEEDQLLPLVAMYNPPFDEEGTLNAFFFASPVSQPGSSLKYLLNGKADWESPALNQLGMCQNYCDDENCEFENKYWATMHIYVNSSYKDLTCPGGSGIVGRSCDLLN